MVVRSGQGSMRVGALVRAVQKMVCMAQGCNQSCLQLPMPVVPSPRFIKSERSIILLNFCLSILASNILILVGQSRVLSKAGAGSGGAGVRVAHGKRWQGSSAVDVDMSDACCMCGCVPTTRVCECLCPAPLLLCTPDSGGIHELEFLSNIAHLLVLAGALPYALICTVSAQEFKWGAAQP